MRALHSRAESERCYGALTPGELRVHGDGSAPSTIVGYAAVWDSPTELFPGFHEVVRRGAFTKSMQEADVVALFNHDENIPLARLSAGSLQLQEDDHGLLYEASVDRQDPDVLKVIRKIETRAVIGSSFQFKPVKAPQRFDENRKTVTRDLLEVKLIDVSPATFAAYASTSVQLRSWQESLLSEDEDVLIEIYRRSGLTDSELRVKLLSAVERVKAPEPPENGHSAQHQIDLQRTRTLDLLEMAS